MTAATPAYRRAAEAALRARAAADVADARAAWADADRRARSGDNAAVLAYGEPGTGLRLVGFAVVRKKGESDGD